MTTNAVSKDDCDAGEVVIEITNKDTAGHVVIDAVQLLLLGQQ